MLCGKCGKEINDGEAFCSVCGEPVGSANAAGTTGVERASDAGVGAGADAGASAASENVTGESMRAAEVAPESGVAGGEYTYEYAAPDAAATETAAAGEASGAADSSVGGAGDVSFGSAKKNRKGHGGVIAAIAAAVVVVAVVAVAVLVFFKPSSSAKEEFMNALALREDYVSAASSDAYSEFYGSTLMADVTKRGLTDPSSSTGEISFSLAPEVMEKIVAAIPPGMGFDFEALINDFTFGIETKSDPTKGAGSASPLSSLMPGDNQIKISGKLAGANIVSAELTSNADGMIGVKSDELYNKYLAVDLNSLSSSIPELAEYLESMNAMGQLVYKAMGAGTAAGDGTAPVKLLSQETADLLVSRYVDVMSGVLADESFTRTADQTLDGVAGKKFTAVTATMSGQELKDVLTACMATAKADAELQKLVVDAYTMIYDGMGEIGRQTYETLYGITFPEPVSLSGMYESAMSSVETALAGAEIPGNYVIALYLDGKTLSAVNILANGAEGAELAGSVGAASIWFKTVDAAGNGGGALSISTDFMQAPGGAVVGSMDIDSTIAESDGTRTHTVGFDITTGDTMNLHSDYEYARTEGQDTLKLSFGGGGSALGSAGAASDIMGVSYELKVTADGADKYSSEFDMNMSMPLNIFDSSLDGSLTDVGSISYDADMQFGAVQIPQIASLTDAVIVSAEDINSGGGVLSDAGLELVMNAQNFFMENINAFSRYIDLSALTGGGY